MNKTLSILYVNYKINLRINSENKPFIYYWLRNIGIKLPPEIFAYLILISFTITPLLGLIAEKHEINFLGSLNPFYTSLVLILSLLIVEIFINTKKLEINSILLKVIPLTKINFLFIQIATHFVSLRLWAYISFVMLYITFSIFYKYTINNYLFILNIIYFTNIFLLFTSLTFYFKDLLYKIFGDINAHVMRNIRLTFIIMILLLFKFFLIDTNKFIEIEMFQKIIFDNLLIFSFFSVSMLFLSFILCSFRKK